MFTWSLILKKHKIGFIMMPSIVFKANFVKYL